MPVHIPKNGVRLEGGGWWYLSVFDVAKILAKIILERKLGQQSGSPIPPLVIGGVLHCLVWKTWKSLTDEAIASDIYSLSCRIEDKRRRIQGSRSQSLNISPETDCDGV